MSKKRVLKVIVFTLIIFSIAACQNEDTESNKNSIQINDTAGTTITTDGNSKDIGASQDTSELAQEDYEIQEVEEQSDNQTQSVASNNETIEYNGKTYTIINVDCGNMSGERQPNAAVDVGYGDRMYWTLTNKYCQLINVIADKVVLQDDSTEPVNSDGRYYDDEAQVPGTEQEDLDQGHVIADSLGGVSNAYNITPQDSTLNRNGDQAYMEKVIRDAGGCENFVATITYPDTTTQIPSHYHYEYDLKGNHIVDDFDNGNPDEANTEINSSDSSSSSTNTSSPKVNSTTSEGDLSSVDTNENGKVTIAEAKAAGYTMPITSDNWLYKYMIDNDGDGMVGE